MKNGQRRAGTARPPLCGSIFVGQHDGDGRGRVVSQSDYEGMSGAAFRWDEWERLSLDAACDDAKFITEIRAFWDCHFPFLFSVHSGYAYHAICTAADQFGHVVEGYEPLFEEALPVADSFESFLTAFLDGKRNT